MKIYDSITELVGNTPMIRLNSIEKEFKLESKLLLKLENFNPSSSVKDRIALNMINEAEKNGEIDENSILIEPTSGNTGIGLAMVAASRNLKLTLVMPDSMSIERRKILKALGADLILTKASLGMRGAIDKAEKLCETEKKYFMLKQFSNSANPEIHKKTTAVEIWNDCDKKIDIFVAGVGTGGTLTGVGEKLKEFNQNIKIVAVEPVKSAVLSGDTPGAHKIQGIGAGFIPEVLNVKIIDEIVKIEYKEAVKISRLVGKKEGILGGISSGANIAASIKIAEKEENRGKTIVTILCDSGERYLSTPLFEE